MWWNRQRVEKPSRKEEAKLCSFCRKRPDQVGYLITSPVDDPPAFICDECVAVCNSILEDRREELERGASEA